MGNASNRFVVVVHNSDFILTLRPPPRPSHYSAEYDDNRVTGGGMDLDNLIKFFMDSMNGVLWDDDRQVVRVGGVKVWDDVGEGEGGIDFCVRVLEEDEVGNLGSGFLEEDDVFDDGNGGNGD